MIERVSDVDDKRKTYVRLTGQGQTILESGASPLPLNFVLNIENNVRTDQTRRVKTTGGKSQRVLGHGDCHPDLYTAPDA